MIEVFFLGEWRPGLVANTNARGEVLAEYEFAGGSQQRVFKQTEVRFAYESGALVRARFWSDQSGKFRTKAALLKIMDDNSVMLRKPDMTELTIPLSSLSETDQKFVKSLLKSGGPTALTGPEPPLLENFGGSGVFGSFAATFGGAGSKPAALVADPIPSYLRLKQGGAAFPLEDFFDRLGAILPVGGPDALLLAAIENGTPSKNLPTRLLWASLAKQKIQGRQLLPPSEVVLDYHPTTRRLLTFTWIEGEGLPGRGTAALTLWEVAPTDKQCKPIVRWNADSGEGGLHEPWARIIDGNTVVQRYKKQEYVAWDTSAKQVKYRVAQESFFAPLATLSGGRKYLFIPEDNGVRVLEAATGSLVSTLPAANGASGVAVSEDGRQAAVLEDNVLLVWDLTNPDAQPQRHQAEAIGTPFSADLYWVGPERVMADQGGFGQVLFSVKTGISLWNYRFDMSAVREDRGRRLREIVDKHLVYGATVSAGSQRGLAVGAVLLPGPNVNEVEAKTVAESLYIIKPGTEVRVQVQTGEHDVRVSKALLAEIEKNGWKLNDSAKVVLTAEMKQGETQQVTYSSGPFGRGDQQTVSITPFISSLQLKMGEAVIWSSGTSTGAPPFVWLKEGQTLQGEVSRWQNPDPGFFERVDIPEKILDPAKRRGLGTTEVTNRGLIPK
jgi:hypothetical protein